MSDKTKKIGYQDEERSPGLRLLKKGQKGLVRAVFSRLGLFVLLLLFQLFLAFAFIYWLREYLPHFVALSLCFSAFMSLYLLNTDTDASAKITWLLVIALFPALGAPLYCYTRSNLGMRLLKKRLEFLMEGTRDSITQDPEVIKSLREESPGTAALAHYLRRSGCFPVYKHTDVKYFPLGEDKWAELLRQLEGSGMPLLSGAIYAQVLLPIGCLAVGMFLGKRQGFCPLYPVLCGAGTFTAVFLLYHHGYIVLLLFCGIAVAFSLLGVAAGAWPREEKKGKGGG